MLVCNMLALIACMIGSKDLMVRETHVNKSLKSVKIFTNSQSFKPPKMLWSFTNTDMVKHSAKTSLKVFITIELLK